MGFTLGQASPSYITKAALLTRDYDGLSIVERLTSKKLREAHVGNMRSLGTQPGFVACIHVKCSSDIYKKLYVRMFCCSIMST